MTTVNMHEAKTHLSRLVDAAADGEIVIIAKAGKPVAKLTRINAPPTPQRIGFAEGTAIIPVDFDTMGSVEIEVLFNGDRH